MSKLHHTPTAQGTRAALPRLHLHGASCVEDTLSESSMLMDILGRRLFASYQVLSGEMFWAVAERFLHVGAVKHDPCVLAWKMLGIAKKVKR
jgi:hypothetical protein